MAAADSKISSEFECGICVDQLNQPKFIGPCNHTFCKDCIDKYRVSLGRGTIPCPECRQECPIPQNGASNLEDNFKLATIIELFRSQQQSNAKKTEAKCTMCPNGATSFCKECDLKLCRCCREQHNRDQKAENHNFVGVCSCHGSGMLFFCSPCKQAVCSSCSVSDHNQGDHEVTPICSLAGNLKSSIRASSAELEDACNIKFGGQEQKLLGLLDIVQQESSSTEVKATADADRTIADKMKEIGDLNAKAQSIQKEIDDLVKKKETVDDNTKLLADEVDNLKKKKTKIIADVRENITISSEDIKQRLKSLNTLRQEITTKVEYCRAVGYITITTDAESIANLTSISHELRAFVQASRERDTKTQIEEVMRSIGELGLDIGDMEQRLAVIRRDEVTSRGEMKQRFRQLKKVCNVSFSRDRPCKVVYQIMHLPDTRIATLARAKSDKYADTIHLHNSFSLALTGTLDERVYPAFATAVSSTGELVVARQEKPPIRIINPATGAHRDINITHDGKVIDELWCVETDESDNMFVSTSQSNPHLFVVVNPSGKVIHSAQLQCVAYKMAYCPVNRILYIAAGDTMMRFHWSNNILKAVSSSSFRCCDVCIASNGEVLVAGWLGKNDIVIYQVTEGDDDEKLVWKKIEYQDGVQRNGGYWPPFICSNGNTLWLGYKDNMEIFLLL